MEAGHVLVLSLGSNRSSISGWLHLATERESAPGQHEGCVPRVGSPVCEPPATSLLPPLNRTIPEVVLCPLGNSGLSELHDESCNCRDTMSICGVGPWCMGEACLLFFPGLCDCHFMMESCAPGQPNSVGSQA